MKKIEIVELLQECQCPGSNNDTLPVLKELLRVFAMNINFLKKEALKYDISDVEKLEKVKLRERLATEIRRSARRSVSPPPSVKDGKKRQHNDEEGEREGSKRQYTPSDFDSRISRAIDLQTNLEDKVKAAKEQKDGAEEELGRLQHLLGVKKKEVAQFTKNLQALEEELKKTEMSVREMKATQAKARSPPSPKDATVSSHVSSSPPSSRLTGQAALPTQSPSTAIIKNACSIFFVKGQTNIKCPVCQARDIEFSLASAGKHMAHIIPRSKGGPSEVSTYIARGFSFSLHRDLTLL
jgi:hypothetical protein